MTQQTSILGFISCLFFTCLGCSNGQVESNSVTVEAVRDEIEVFDFDAFEPLLQTHSENIQIVNFWAMWCAPCVKELPIFQEYEKKYPNTEVLLVSLDFPEDIETKLKPFLKKKGITSKVVVLDDADYNSWIDRVDPNWSGALPFTIVFNKSARSFHEGEFESLQDLEKEIQNTFN